MKLPILSIITPVYNGIRFIDSCLQSVISQNCPSIEHLIIDGGSTDGTIEIVRQYAEQYPHIRWLSEKDIGQSSAMNKGIVLARGSIIGILNYDDFYEPNILPHILKIFESALSPSFVAGNCRTLHEDGTIYYINLPTLNLINILIGGARNQYPHNPSAYFYHKSLHDKIGLYVESDHYSMDLDFILRAIQSAHLQYHNEIFGNYRFIKGTKTYQSMKDNLLETNVRQKLDFYAQQLPFVLQWWIKTMRFIFVDRKPYYFACQIKRNLKNLINKKAAP